MEGYCKEVLALIGASAPRGFTRPRVLLLAPMKNVALDMVLALQGASSTPLLPEHAERLASEFGPTDDDLERLARQKDRMSADFLETFRGNTDDCFRIGIKVKKRWSGSDEKAKERGEERESGSAAMTIVPFCDFYASDVIIASPLGLRFIVDGEAHGVGKRRKVKKGDHDFLSSIELIVVQDAHVIAMQNWDHLVHVIGLVNKIPSDGHGCDFSKVSEVFLDGKGATVRRDVFLTAYTFPELNGLAAGPLQEVVLSCGRDQTVSHPSLLRGARPTFHVLPQAVGLADVPAERFKYFCKTFGARLPPKCCIFVSSYLDFCQLRHSFSTAKVGYVFLSEYSPGTEVSAARTKFFNDPKTQVLLISERFHFFKRYAIRGIQSLIFYSLPENAAFYTDFVGMMSLDAPGRGGGQPPRVDIILSIFDKLKAERIVGSKKINALLGLE